LSLAVFFYGIAFFVILIENHDATEKGDGESSDRVVRCPASCNKAAQGQYVQYNLVTARVWE
jgi:hypothetical protein